MRKNTIGLLFHDLGRTGIRNMIRNGISEKVAMGSSGLLGAQNPQRVRSNNITNYDDLVDTGRKIREGRERIEHFHFANRYPGFSSQR
jgi:hypothetical protein